MGHALLFDPAALEIREGLRRELDVAFGAAYAPAVDATGAPSRRRRWPSA